MARRRYIPVRERAAALAALLLSEERRATLRRQKASADEVIGSVPMHHIIKWADTKGISDKDVNKWWNLHPCAPGEHKEIEGSLSERKYTRAIKRGNRELQYGTARARPRRKLPSRKLQSRPFPKTTR